MVRNDGEASGLTVYGVEDEVVVAIDRTSGDDRFVATTWHIFGHINPRSDLYVGQTVTSTTDLGTILNMGTRSHLHFTSTTSSYTSGVTILGNGYENNPIDPSFSSYWRFDNLYSDYTAPVKNSVEFWTDGLGTRCEPHNLRTDRNYDIVVKAQEGTAYPDANNRYAVDWQNGVYKLGYNVNSPPATYNLKFREDPRLWNINLVYDRSRSTQSDFYYVITNTMSSNGYVRFTTPGSYTIYISLVDEQNNEHQQTEYVNVYTGISEEPTNINIPTSFQLSENCPDPFYYSTLIPFQLPKKCEISLIIYDKAGQKVRTLKQDKMEPGYHKTVWDGRDDFGRKVACGIYFCHFKAGNFKEIRKMVLIN